MSTRKDLHPRLVVLQQRLGAAQGKQYWRSLEELAGSDAFQELMRSEFPEQADVWPDSLSRRHFLTLMGASLALAGLGGCSVRPAPSVDLVPYVRAPEEMVPGKPLFFATSMTHGGSAVGLLVESHMGRPTKIEGNPEHPASLGATDVFHQASVLALYDPDRSQTVTHLGQTRTWDQAIAALRGALREQRERRGAGLRLLTETVVSPTLAGQLEELLEALPEAKWHQYEPVHRDSAYRAAQMAFGEYVNSLYDFRKADVVLSLDADFLASGPGHLRHVSDFMSRRRVRTTDANSGTADMNRLYVVETAVSCTGAKADHRLALTPRAIEDFARRLAAELGATSGARAAGKFDRWVAVVANDLAAHRGRSLVIAGDRQPAAVHLLAHVLNDRLGNVGETLSYTSPVEAQPGDQTQSITDLAYDMEAGQVETLLILGANPVYAAPVDLQFAQRLQRVPLRVHLSLYQDETSRQCHWHLPETHYLEAWSDARAYDGTASIVQPLIEPLYQGRSAHEVVSLLADLGEIPGQQIVKSHWRKQWEDKQSANEQPAGDFEQFWLTAVHDGIVRDSAFPLREVALRDAWQQDLAAAGSLEPDQLELAFQSDPTIGDGRFANNGWLQELPKPITKLTWDNAAILSPATAKRLGLSMGQYAHGGEHGGYYMPMVELQTGSRKLRAAVWMMPGHADDCVTIHLGYGRRNAGKVGGSPEQQVGFDAYVLRTADQPWFAGGLRVAKTGEVYLLACTQEHQLMENRELVRSATLAEYHERPRFAAAPDDARERELQPRETGLRETGPRKVQEAAARQRATAALTLYEPFDYSAPKHKWGMSIDLTTCIGCNACVVACQAENNIPVVGKEQVAAGREMHWLPVDRYLHGTSDDPQEFYFQPVPCMQCENAPCEYVCPVAATVHSAEGLNDMVYNRCVGTRFCSNNCPYKVRRFNFFEYGDFLTPSRRLQYNPDVTVRSRGVMEKCTYCVQRIRQAEIDSQVEDRSLVDGEVLTACQAVCPARAIVFGDIYDSRSDVAHDKDSPLNYSLLAELNTKPRTTYLAALRNPNVELEAE